MKERTFGWVRGGKSSKPLPMGASEVIKAQSGRFVTPDASNRGEVAGDGDASLLGFVESGDQTCSATEGGTVLNCIDDLTAVFEIPLRYDGSSYTVNYSDALIGEKRDLVVVSSVQYCNATESTEGTIIIVGGTAAASTTSNDGSVLCRLNPATIAASGA